MDEREKKHNSIVDLVNVELIKRGYTGFYKYVKYKYGEIDLLCLPRNTKYALLFEIKTHYTPCSYNKAIKQLDRAERKFLNNFNYKVFKFFVYEDYKGEIKYEWIKKRRNMKW